MSLTGLLPRLLVLIAALIFSIVVPNSELLRFDVSLFVYCFVLFICLSPMPQRLLMF